MLTIDELQALIASHPDNCWQRLLTGSVEAVGRGLADKAIPAEITVERLADWSRGARSAQRGLLLLTAHRAKGLEFDHVVILDGGWDRSSGEEDADAERQLFCVAATRARESLAITMRGAKQLVLSGDFRMGLLERHIAPDLAEHARHYQQADLKNVDLSYVLGA